MRKPLLTGFLVLALFAGTNDGCAAELVLVDQGQALCTIVTGKDDGLDRALTATYRPVSVTKPSNLLAEAAADFAEHLNKVGKIPFHQQVHRAGMVKVVAEIEQAKTPCRILLGSAAIEKYGLQNEADQLSAVGYICRTSGSDLLIFGSTSKGTVNGIYGFLQDELGVRWFGTGPGDIFTVIPAKDTVSLGTLDKKIEPSFYGRQGSTNFEITPSGSLWCRRLRQGDGMMRFGEASHHLFRLFPVSKYFTDHPEYYWMKNGVRTIYEKNAGFQVCYSNPDVEEITSQAALAYFRGGKHRDSFSVGIQDMEAYCECPECTKLQPQRSFGGGRVASDMYYHFVNAVARRTAKEFPDRYLGAIAYNDVTAPPLGPMEKNVFVVLVIDISEYFDPAFRQQSEELVKAWEGKGCTLGLYYYNSLNTIVPFSWSRHLAAQLQDKYRRGFRVLFNEGTPNGPLGYVDARLHWDINLDVDTLLEEYFTTLYGPAAKPMQELYGLFEEIHLRPRKGGFLYEHGKFLQFRPYGEKDLATIKRLLAQAHQAINGMGVGHRGDQRIEERRVAYVSNNLKVFLDMLEGIVLAQKLGLAKGTLDDIEILSRLDTVARINAILNRNDALFRETLILDLSASWWNRWETQPNIRLEWKTHLSTVVGDALVAMYRVAHPDGSRTDARVKDLLAKEIGVYTGDKVRDTLFRYRTGAIQPGENKVSNPGFEEDQAGKVYPAPEVVAKLDWNESKVSGWSYWQAVRGTGRFAISAKLSNTGKRSGVMRGIGSGCYIACVPEVKEGEIYLVQAVIRNTAQVTRVDAPEVSLRVAWLNEKNAWTQQGLDSRVKATELDRWITLEQVVQIPAKVSTAVISIDAGPLFGEEEVFVDDVSFRLLR